MSEIFVDTIRKTGGSLGTDIRIKNTSVYESDGGTSVTQNLVQGLAKVYGVVNQNSTQTIVGSFNLSGITDTAVGQTTKSYTNNMSDATYSVVGSANTSGSNYFQHQHYTAATGSIGIYNSPDQSLSNADGIPCTAILGDLA